jgi:hypothetical protein
MNRHRTDLVALILGLAFAMTGVGFIISETTDSNLSGGAVVAGGLIVLGVVALLVTLLRPKQELAGVPSVSETGIPPSSEGDNES